MAKICIISRNFPPTICGVGDYSYWLAKTFGDFDNEITVITSDKNKNFNEKNNIIAIGNSWGTFKLINTISALKPDIVIIQYVCQMYGRAGIAPAIVISVLLIKLLFRKTKLLITFHELWIPLNPKEFILGIIQRLQVAIIAITADIGIVTTQSRKKALNRLFPWKKIYKIPVGSNIPIRDLKHCRDEVLLPDALSHNLILSTFGRLHPERDLITVLKTIPIILKNYDKVILKVIGKIDTGPDYNTALEEIKQLGIEKNIEWTSTCTAGEIIKHLQNSDVYISPEFDGASGRRTTVMAALSCGLPIIAYNGYDTEKVFINEENIILISPKSPEILAENIIKLAKDKNKMLSLGKEARKTFDAYFSWEKIGKKYEEIFQTFNK